MALTTWTAGTFMKFIPPSGIPIVMDIHADQTVLLATLIISIFTGLIFGVLPALRSSRVAPMAVLKQESTSASSGLHKARLSSGLVVAQISLSLFLLVCAGLFIRSFRNSQHAYPGFNAEHVLLASFDLLPSSYNDAQGLEFDRQLLAKLQALPGAESASISTWVPLGFSLSSSTIKVEGYSPQPHESMDIDDALVGPNYLHTMQIPVVEGREFTLQDSPNTALVAVVNQTFAGRYWPHQDAIGKRIYVDEKWFVVVGVARDSDYYDLQEDRKPFLYLPLFQEYSHGTIVHLRVAGDPEAFAPTLEKTIHQLNADLPVFDVNTLESRVQVASIGERVAGTFAGVFGLLALVLASVGIYGVISYSTRQRTHEIGIRMALGAQRLSILRLVLRHGVTLTVAGVLIGLAGSFFLTRFLGALLFHVSPRDTLTFLGVAVLLCAVALLACYLPARRAMKVDPMVALRYE